MQLLSTRFSPDQSTQWRARLPVVAELVLVALLTLQVARLAWLALSPAGLSGTTTAGPPTTVAASPSLPRADVFFRSTRAPDGSSDEAFGYTLFGVRSDGGHGSAILGKDGEQASHAVGREVATGIVLESVGPGHAVLLANGVRQRLALPPLATAGTAPAATTLPVGKPRAAAPQAPAVSPPTGATTTGPAIPPQSPASPDPAGSTGDGYLITPGVRAALLRPAGLQPGDVVLSVNGRPLDPARLAGLRNELKGQAQVTIQYRRDGKTHTATVQAP